MTFSRRVSFKALLALLLLWVVSAHALTRDEIFHRDFWSPTYHIKRLNYCTPNGKECGLPLASRFCKLLGYVKADKVLIEYNVGETNYFPTAASCKGCQCNGFKLIRCMGYISHKPSNRAYYRNMRYVFPRFEGSRVDWCFDKEQGCGQRAANSFCRRMGYRRANAYKRQEHVLATRTIGSQRLCFGTMCRGFHYITCYR